MNASGRASARARRSPSAFSAAVPTLPAPCPKVRFHCAPAGRLVGARICSIVNGRTLRTLQNEKRPVQAIGIMAGALVIIGSLVWSLVQVVI